MNLTKLFTSNFFFFSPLGSNYIVDAENLKAKNIEHFYNSVYLLGEFYNRLHQKAHPILIMGKSLFELLTKQLRKELTNCTNDAAYTFDVRFARLLLAQVCLNRFNFSATWLYVTLYRSIVGDVEWQNGPSIASG